MTNLTKLAGFTALVLGGVAATSASATSIYNSNGFEAPTFLTGSVVGQDGWASFTTAATSTATGEIVAVGGTNQVQSGTQSLNVTRFDDETAGSTGFFPDVTAAAVSHDSVVYIQWDMYVVCADDQDPDPIAESFGPGFALEVYTTGNTRLLGLGMDAATAELYTLTSNSPAEPLYSSAPVLAHDVWQAWEVVLDFNAEAYYLIVDGTPINIGGTPFLEDIDYAGGDRLTDAPIITFPTDFNYIDIEGEAFIDNYRISDGTVVPEPATAALAGLAGLALLRRRAS